MLWLGVSLLALVAGDQGYRWLQRRRAQRRIDSALRSLGWRADRSAADLARRLPGWAPDLVSIVEAKQAELDGRRSAVVAGDGTDPRLAAQAVLNEASALGADYAGLQQLVGRLDLAELARGWPHPKLDELLAARDQAGVATPARPDPPAGRHLSRLANDRDRLDARRQEVLELVAQAPVGDGSASAASGEVLAAIEDLIERWERLSEATDRAWARMFPDRAATAD